MKAKVLSAILFLIMTCATTQVYAIDTGIGITAGYSEADEVQFFRGAFKIAPGWKWFEEGNWHLGLHIDLALIYLNSDSDVENINDDPDDLHAFAITPVWRIQRLPYANTISPYFQFAVGASFFSEDNLQSDQPIGLDFGGTFQFEDSFSLGIRFGEQQQFDVSGNYYHYSNLDIYDANDGIDIWSATFSYWF